MIVSAFSPINRRTVSLWMSGGRVWAFGPPATFLSLNHWCFYQSEECYIFTQYKCNYLTCWKLSSSSSFCVKSNFDRDLSSLLTSPHLPETLVVTIQEKENTHTEAQCWELEIYIASTGDFLRKHWRIMMRTASSKQRSDGDDLKSSYASGWTATG